jgi:hypothetical protein
MLARFEAVEEHSELARLRENFHEIGQDVFYLSEGISKKERDPNL